MKTAILLLLFIPSCWNSPPEETYCFKCNQDTFCDYTQEQIDILMAADTSLVCVKDTLNLIIQ